MRERKADVGTRQRHAAKHVIAMCVLGSFGLEEFTPCRCVPVKVQDFDSRAWCLCGGFDFAYLASLTADAPGMGVASPTTGDGHPCHCGNRRQCLATKTKTCYFFEIIEAGNFAGGVARECKRQFVLRNALAIVADA